LLISFWSVERRPRRPPEVAEWLSHDTVREGQATHWHVAVRAPADDHAGSRIETLATSFGAPPWAALEPVSGAVVAAAVDGRAMAQVRVRSIRWGRREVVSAQVVASSAWGAFRWSGDRRPSLALTTLPVPSAFDSAAPAVHPQGHVGQHRSARPGDGTEFASVRPFQVGDRLRRIHWPQSLRTGTLHVTSTWADQDTLVVIVVDAFNDLGDSDGIDGRASSLDVTVRAAGAIAEHHLRSGDRVALHVLGARRARRVPPASGRAHLRRVLDSLTAIEPGTDLRDQGRLSLGLPAGALVVMLSPLASPAVLQRAAGFAARGLTTVVVDTLPPGVVAGDERDPVRALAWRIRLLERRREMRRIQQLGVPVVSWRGPGSLDQVLRDLHRQGNKPRLVGR
jgi:uncharacterized protein (DUF58 family)